MKKINIIQFMPYFPPHKGGLETHGEQWGIYWKKNNFGEVYNVISDFNQKGELEKNEKIMFENNIIGYKKNGIENLVVPSLEIINNFPVYKIWDKKYLLIKKYLKNKISPHLASPKGRGIEQNWRIITHTRFFLTSFIGGLFARRPHPTPLLGEEREQQGIKWIHIEHGSDYVKLSSKIKTNLSIIYDKIFGKWIFKKADKILAISQACKNFINKEFVDREVEVFYRGIELEDRKIKKQGEIKLVFIGRLVKLKGVDYLLEVFEKLSIKNKLIIIGDGEEKENLENFVKENNLDNVEFLGFKNKNFIEDFLAENNCILINPSYQEGLPTTVIEGLFYKNVVVASNVGGTSEISDKDDLVLFEAGNKKELREKIIFALKDYDNIVGKSEKIVKKKFSWEKNILKLYNFVK